MLQPSVLSRTAGSIARDRFRRYGKRGVLVAGLFHLGFLLLFAWLRVPSMVWLNLASVLIYLTAFAVLLRPRSRPAAVLGLVWLELVGHVFGATWLLGWASGFHYYVLVLAPLLFTETRHSSRIKLAYLGVVMALYVLLERLLGQRAPATELERPVLDALRYFNMTGTAALLAFLTDSFARAVQVAEGRLRTIATIDPLTGLSNRRHITTELVERLARRTPMALVLLDLDHFKAINDRFGHAAGDAVLVRTGQLLRDGARQGDYIARWGGEEFLMLLPDCQSDQALQIAERLRLRFEAERIDCDGQAVQVTLSLGVSLCQPGDAFDRALRLADRALYRAKAEGRNRSLLAEG